jgi:hypothetical protein
MGGDDLDACEPRRIGVRGPSSQVSGPVAADHVDHDPFLEIDEPGRVDRRVVAVGA